MDIKRRKITYDVAHGGNFNNDFEDKGILYHQAGDGIDADAKNITDSELTFDDSKKELTTTNVHITNELNVDGETTLNDKTTINGDTTVNADLAVNGDAVISGNLHIKGDSYEEHATDLFVGSDLITLRDGAETSLVKDARSGIVINSYDGEDSLGILGDNTGTLRVGEYNTSKVYTTDGSTFYSDFELTQPVDLGDKTKWKFGEQDGVQIWYAVDKDDTRAVATRADNMGDGQLTCWSEDTCSIESIGDKPGSSHSILSYCEPRDIYYWSRSPEHDSQVLTSNEDGLKWSEYTNTNGSLMVYNHNQVEYLKPCGGAVDRVLMSCNNELRWDCPDGIWCRGTVRKIESGDSNCLICWCPDSDGTVHLPNMITNITLNGTTYTTPKPGVAVNLGNVVRSVTINGNTQTVGTSGNVSFTVNASVCVCQGCVPDSSDVLFVYEGKLYSCSDYYVDYDGINSCGIYVSNRPAKICHCLCVQCCSWFRGDVCIETPACLRLYTTLVWDRTAHGCLFRFPSFNTMVCFPDGFFTGNTPYNWTGCLLAAKMFCCGGCNYTWQNNQTCSYITWNRCSWGAMAINCDLLIQWGGYGYSCSRGWLEFPYNFCNIDTLPIVIVSGFECRFDCNDADGWDYAQAANGVSVNGFCFTKSTNSGMYWLALGKTR